MTKKEMSNKNLSFKIDLTKIDGDGSFPCPKCGTVISPEDETEQLYKIVNTKVINDQLVELVIECSACKTNITLTGFETTIEGLTHK
jgi:predicted RNA-binding Zn-ribbon protein involved in translation (DUF1610 family)